MPTINGTNISETLTGSAYADLIRGRKGDDLIIGNAGNDELRGQDGRDTLMGGDGYDEMWGGADRYTFVISTDGFGDRIRDWESRDTIDLTALGVTGLDQLNIVYQGGFATIYSEKDGSLIISSLDGSPITAADLTADKFIFAAPQPRQIDFETLESPLYSGEVLNNADTGHASFNWTSPVFF